MSKEKYFIDVILPVALPKLYTYGVPDEFSELIRVGQRVIVQFGKHKIYSAIIENIHNNAPADYQPKDILSLLDEKPVVNQKQLDFWKWIAAYYMCTLGEVMNAALPTGLKLSSETKIIINPSFTGDYTDLTEKEFLITEALANRNILSLVEISELLGQRTIHHIIKSLIDKGVVVVHEELVERYKPKLETYIKLSDEAEVEDNLKLWFDKLGKAPKQLELLISYINLSKRYSENKKKVKKTELLKSVNITSAPLNQLIKKGLFEQYTKEVDRLGSNSDIFADGVQPKDAAELNEHQSKAIDEIKNSFETKDVVLLHGITSSGKTELYIQLIKETLDKGKQVLYLLPEIALTTQIIERLKKHFGNKVSVYHSKFSQNERVEVWNNILKNNEIKGRDKSSIILGPRSSIFLPFNNLGLIIVDEEHDSSYKQFNPGPNYQARDAAIYLSQLHSSKVLLGSATPSVESYYNARSGKYGLVEINHRFGDIKLPEIEIVDIQTEHKKHRMKSIFSQQMIDYISIALEKGEQVILFQNRRGFAPMLECQTCGWTPHCQHCDVSLTYHKHINLAKCHYCGYSIETPSKCSACGDVVIKMKGFGTEKIEEELATFFPKANISRMDLDTTRSKHSYHNIISNFEDRKVDILVGTQMITKGLDFDNVSLVGILNADNMINFPDFRAHERSFQLMMQVSGRAGRKNKQGKVLIQTFTPDHVVIQQVVENNFIGMYQNEIIQRRNFKYPPFFRLIQINLKHQKIDYVNGASKLLAKDLRKHFDKRVLGPEFPIISRVKNLFIKNILIKIERDSSLNKAKKLIHQSITQVKTMSDFKSVNIHVDIDPM